MAELEYENAIFPFTGGGDQRDIIPFFGLIRKHDATGAKCAAVFGTKTEPKQHSGKQAPMFAG